MPRFLAYFFIFFSALCARFSWISTGLGKIYEMVWPSLECTGLVWSGLGCPVACLAFSRPVAEISIVQAGVAGHVNSCHELRRWRRALSMKMDFIRIPFSVQATPKAQPHQQPIDTHTHISISISAPSWFKYKFQIFYRFSIAIWTQKPIEKSKNVWRLGLRFVWHRLQQSSFVKYALHRPLFCAHALWHLW